MTDFGVILLHCYLCTPIHPRHTSDSVSSLILCYWGGLQDIDLVGEMGKQPGDSPAGGIEGTPLMMVIQSMMVHGDVVKFRKDKSLIHTKPRSFFKTLQFLLSVGADPNRQGTDEDGITPIRSHSQLCCPLANTHTHTHTHTGLSFQLCTRLWPYQTRPLRKRPACFFCSTRLTRTRPSRHTRGASER